MALRALPALLGLLLRVRRDTPETHPELSPLAPHEFYPRYRPQQMRKDKMQQLAQAPGATQNTTGVLSCGVRMPAQTAPTKHSPCCGITQTRHPKPPPTAVGSPKQLLCVPDSIQRLQAEWRARTDNPCWQCGTHQNTAHQNSAHQNTAASTHTSAHHTHHTPLPTGKQGCTGWPWAREPQDKTLHSLTCLVAIVASTQCQEGFHPAACTQEGSGVLLTQDCSRAWAASGKDLSLWELKLWNGF